VVPVRERAESLIAVADGPEFGVPFSFSIDAAIDEGRSE
jgi:hypothetical protein